VFRTGAEPCGRWASPGDGDSPNWREEPSSASRSAAEVPEDVAQHPAEPALGHFALRRHAPLRREPVDQTGQRLAEEGEQAGPFHPGVRSEPSGLLGRERPVQFLRRDGPVRAGGDPALDPVAETAAAEPLDQGLQPRSALLPAHEVVQDLIQRRALQIVQGSAAHTRQELAHEASSWMTRSENAVAAATLLRPA
jgi:hypothetical protein